MKEFNTNDEAITYAKEHPGVVITRSANGGGYIVKEARKKFECNVSSKESSLKSALAPIKELYSGFMKSEQSDDRRAILIETNERLNYIVACILQTDVKNANKFTKNVGQALASKLTGAGVSGGLLGLVSTFGTAGTGTAIGTLSGASATSATLAWVGGIVGGGMVAGTVLTGGLAVGVGFVTYKLISSKEREYSELTTKERDIVDKAIIIIRIMDEIIETLSFPTKEKMKDYLNDYICPLAQLVIENEDHILANLDTKNRLAFNLHAIPDFEKLLDKYKIYLNV